MFVLVTTRARSGMGDSVFTPACAFTGSLVLSRGTGHPSLWSLVLSWERGGRGEWVFHSGLEQGYPLSPTGLGQGYPLPDTTCHGQFMSRAVCLLQSRKTFFFSESFQYIYPSATFKQIGEIIKHI